MKKSKSSLLHDKHFLEYAQHKKSHCEVCGENCADQRDADGFLRSKAKVKLTVHHIDGDVSNNTPENLQTLCRKCHDDMHNGNLPRMSLPLHHR